MTLCSRGGIAIGVLAPFILAACFISPAGAAIDMEQARQACMPDVIRLCNNDIPDRERIEACLRRESRYLSPACHSIMMSGRRAVHRERRHRQH